MSTFTRWLSHSAMTSRSRTRRTILLLTLFVIVSNLSRLLGLPLPFLPYRSRTALKKPLSHDFLPLADAQLLCEAHGLPLYSNRSCARKIYDLVTISSELDWLEIRMNELDSLVDYFVVIEASETFTGNQKPMTFRDNYSRFAQFAPKILYHAVDLSPFRENSTWEREAYSRNALFTSIFPSLFPPAAPSLNDVILVSDADEIPRPQTLVTLRNCDFPDRVTLRSRFYYYSFQWQHLGDEWHHPQATFFAGLNETILPEDLRMGGGHDIWNASWHCSSCFSTVSEFINKIKSFSHTEYNEPWFTEPSEIVRRVRNGFDLFDRGSEIYERTLVTDVPAYVKGNKQRFAYMLDRDPLNGNFMDYTL